MIERLTVENFAGMKHVVPDIGKINLLIGPQATGKGVCAKLLYSFKNFDRQLVQAVVDGKSPEELNAQLVIAFRDYFPQDSWPSGCFNVQYTVNGLSFKTSRTSGAKASLRLQCPAEFGSLHKTLLGSLGEGRTGEGEDGNDAERRLFQTFLETEKGGQGQDGHRPARQSVLCPGWPVIFPGASKEHLLRFGGRQHWCPGSFSAFLWRSV